MQSVTIQNKIRLVDFVGPENGRESSENLQTCVKLSRSYENSRAVCECVVRSMFHSIILRFVYFFDSKKIQLMGGVQAIQQMKRICP